MEDLERVNEYSFFHLIAKRPYYKELIYCRFNFPVGMFRILFGSYDVSISKIQIGGGLYLEHPHGTHLNAKKIGKNFTCSHNVTLGANHGGVPEIGDNVYCGVGACVLGAIKIGNNVKIGANCVITKDVPDNCTIIGNPPIIVKLNNEKVKLYL